jgi:hypothetical protein
MEIPMTHYLDYHFEEVELSNGQFATGYAEVEYTVGGDELDFFVACINVTLNDGDDNFTELTIKPGDQFYAEICKDRDDWIAEKCWDAYKGSF